MSNARFWVIGGEYRSLDFNEIIDGTQCLLGPFEQQDIAQRNWRDLSERHRSNCTARFTIVRDG